MAKAKLQKGKNAELSDKLIDILTNDNSELGENIKAMMPIFNTVIDALNLDDKIDKTKLIKPKENPFDINNVSITVDDYEIPSVTWNQLLDVAKKFIDERK